MIYSYKAGSASAKTLSETLGVRRIKHRNSRFRGREGKTVINWGSSELPLEVTKCRVINSPEMVKMASNKLHFFQMLDRFNDNRVEGDKVQHPEFTSDKGKVRDWLAAGDTVVVRKKLTGNSGEGIELLEGLVDVPDAPLYTRYVKKRDEFRVHVGRVPAGIQCIDTQRKARNRDVPDENVNWKVRNNANGFIFARNEDKGDIPQDVLKQAKLAVEACGLDFGAVDVVYNAGQNKAYVIEVNTAPGLQGTTIDKYREFFQGLL